MFIHPPVCLVWHKLKCWTLCTKFSTKFFDACLAGRYNWPLLFYSTVSGLDWGWRLQSQGKEKPVGFFFSNTSQLIWIKFYVVLQQLNCLILLQREISVIEENIWSFTDCVWKLYHWHALIQMYEPTLFRLGLMIGTTELYICLLIWVTLAVIQGLIDVRKQNLMHQLSSKVLDPFGWTFQSCWEILVWGTFYSLYHCWSIMKGEICT